MSIVRASLLLTVLSVALDAGFVKMWQLKETAAAPVLVVGRVLSVAKHERMAEGSLPWKAETWAMVADIEVLRSFTAPGKPLVAGRIQVRYFTYGPSVRGFINGYPPALPQFEPDKILLLPLLDGELDGELALIDNSGVHLTIPVRAENLNREPMAENGRAFVLREVANSFAQGTPQEVSGVSGWLAGQYENLTPELMPLLEAMTGDNPQRWAEVATSVLAAQGIPRPNVAELRSDKEMPLGPMGASLSLARAALRKLAATPETDNLLIRNWIADSPWNSWGAANSLLEYGDNPVTTETLRRALNEDIAGTSFIAMTLVRNGHQAVLHDALLRALRVVDRPEPNYTDLQGAAALLRDYGSAQQLRELADIVAKYQTVDRKFYGTLWQYATEGDNPREARVLAVVLRDKNLLSDQIGSGETRVCDFAVGVLERAVKQKFGAGATALADRDAAVALALAWIKSNGFPN